MMRGLTLRLVCVIIVCVCSANGEVVHLVPAHFFCPTDKQHDVLIPDPTDCRTYYKCSNNFTIPETCPDGLEWCVQLSLCTMPLLSDCVVNKTIIRYSDEELVTYRPPVLQCEIGMTDGNFTTAPSTTHEVCPFEGALSVDTSDRTFFYQCVNKKPVRKQCSLGEEFDPWKQKCSQTDRNSTKPGYLTAGYCNIPHIFVPDMYDCRTYYVCYNGLITSRVCPFGLTFNKWFGICFLPEYSKCSSTQYSTTETNEVTETTTVVPTRPVGPPCTIDQYSCPHEDYTLPDHSDCTSFWICKKGVPQKKSCPNGQSFSPWAHQCVSNSDGVCSSNVQNGENCSSTQDRIPLGQDPTSFWECSDFNVRKRECNKNTAFNPWTKRCDVWTCGYTTQPPPPTLPKCHSTYQVIPNLNRCNSYYSCATGSPTLIQCPDNLVYNCALEHCSSKVIQNCCPNDPNLRNYTSTLDCTIPGYKIPDPTACNRYLECVNKILVLKSCGHNDIFDVNTYSCQPDIDGVCTDVTTVPPTTPSCVAIQNSCSIENLTQPSSDCSSYWECDNGQPKKRFCPSGKTYSPWDHKCIPKDNELCASNMKYGDRCPSKQDRIIIYGNDTFFWECFNHTVRPRHCIPGSSFNPWTKRCIECTGSTTPYGTTEMCSGGSCSTEGITCVLDTNTCNVENLTQPNSDCKSYWKCIDGMPKKQFCSGGENFDPWKKICIPKDDTVCAHNIKYGDYCPSMQDRIVIDGDETFFWECFNHTVRDRRCMPGSVFNQWTRRCVVCKTTETTTQVMESETDKTTTCVGSSCKTTTTNPCNPVRTTCTIANLTHPSTDCTSYWICLDGHPQKLNCPTGETYSPWDHKCVPKNNILCASNINKGDYCSSFQDRIMIDGNSTYFWECHNYAARIRHCTPNSVFDQWTKKCVKCEDSETTTDIQREPIESCDDTECEATTTTTTCNDPTCSSSSLMCQTKSQIIPNITDCTSYYTCSSGYPEYVKCPAGLVFNCIFGFCTLNCFPNCCLNDQKVGTYPATTSCSVWGSKIVDPFACNKYYECVSGQVSSKSCKAGERFDVITSSCQLDTKGVCTGVATTTTSTTTSVQTQTPSSSTCQSTSQVIPHWTDCTSYYICSFGYPMNIKCPAGLVFNCILGYCSLSLFPSCCSNDPKVNTYPSTSSCSSWGSKIVDPFACNKYYECVLGQMTSKSCNLGERFDFVTSSCQLDTKGVCTGVAITTTPTTTIKTPPRTCISTSQIIPNVIDCTSYYICSFGYPLLIRCPAGLVFNCILGYCSQSAYLNCCANDPKVGTYTSTTACTSSGTKYYDPLHCDQYFQCVSNNVVTKSCNGNDKIFDYLTLSCLSDTKGVCAASTTVSTTVAETSKTSTKSTTETTKASGGGGCGGSNNC